MNYFRKRLSFIGKKSKKTIEILKKALTIASALITIDYEPGAGEIITAFNVSGRE
jgi:hypothetical protein